MTLLPPVLSVFHRQNPGVKISLAGGVIDTLVPDLLRGELDLICVSLDFPNRAEIVKVPLITVRHVLIADPAHPLAERRGIDAAAAHGYPWMTLKGDHVGKERIGSFFAANGLSPPMFSLETSSIESLLQSLRDGKSIAHIPELMLPLAEAVGLKRLSFSGTIWENTAGYAVRKSARRTPMVRRLVEMLEANVRNDR